MKDFLFNKNTLIELWPGWASLLGHDSETIQTRLRPSAQQQTCVSSLLVEWAMATGLIALTPFSSPSWAPLNSHGGRGRRVGRGWHPSRTAVTGRFLHITVASLESDGEARQDCNFSLTLITSITNMYTYCIRLLCSLTDGCPINPKNIYIKQKGIWSLLLMSHDISVASRLRSDQDTFADPNGKEHHQTNF